jgi:outer membrane protein TolC
MKSRIYYRYIVFALASLVYIPASAQQQELSLQEAITLAVSSNPELKASTLEIEKSRQQRVVARSLYLPTVNVNAQANHYFQLTPFFGFGENTSEGKIPYGRFGGEDQVGAAIAAVQPLYNPLAHPSLQRARLEEQESRAASRGKQLVVQTLVKQTYLRILVLNERIKLQQESINRNKRVLLDSRSLLLQGKGLRVDTLRAYTSVKNLEPDLVKLSYAVETSKLQLKTLIGIDSLNDIVLTDSLVVPAPGTLPSEEQVYNEAKANNPDFQVLALKEQISHQSVRTANALRKPVLSAIAQYQVQSQTNNFEYGNAYYPTSSFVGLQLSVPLFTGFSTQAKVKQANYSKEQSGLTLHYAHEQLRSSVHEALAQNQETILRLQNTAIVKETAQLSYNIIQYRYKSGIASRLELTDAELALSTAQSNYLEAVYDYLNARIVLLRIMGSAE